MSEHSYYDVSMLKKPVWKWQIVSYFFLGGLSAGAYLLARAAERFGGTRHSEVTRVGTIVALGGLIPCPALLIWDLGDPQRFHHMLRVFKPRSPMNLGAWLLTGYGAVVSSAAFRELRRVFFVAGGLHRWTGRTAGKLWSRPVEAETASTAAASNSAQALLVAEDTAGVPLATGVAGYTGVLLSCTSNPLWCKNHWLGPLFSASALSTGAEAISLALDCAHSSSPTLEASRSVLRKVDTLAHAAEGVCLAGFVHQAGERARPLRTGSVRGWYRFAAAALVASEVLKLLPVGERLRRPARILSAATGLAGGFALRWALVYGGKEAAEDAHLARLSSSPAQPSLAETPDPELSQAREHFAGKRMPVHDQTSA